MNNSFSPNLINIEINGSCNMACSYCPNVLSNRKSLGDMDPKLFDSLIEQLVDLEYTGRIAFEFYNEPLLAKNFNDFVRKIKKNLPRCHIVLYTNGTKINTEARLNELFDIGIDEFFITKHEGLKSLKVENLIDDLPISLRKKITFRGHDDVYFVNRGGLLSDLGTKDFNQKTPCFVASVMMVVTVEGNVLPCTEDFQEKLIMGNIKDTHVREIWSSLKYTEFREDLRQGRRSKYDVCNKCNRESQSFLDEKPIFHSCENEVSAVSRVINNKQLFRYKTSKSECDHFEDELCSMLNIDYAHLVNSGTNALILALQAAGIGPGDEVLIPAYASVGTASAVINVGAIPVICNINEQLSICNLEIKKHISKRTKAVIPVYMDGLSCDIEKICEEAKNHNLLVIENVCQSFGAKFKDIPVGTWGDFGCYSFNQNKITNLGEGGVVVAKSRENYERILLNSDSAYSFSPMNKNRINEVTPFMGGSMRVSEIIGALMRVQLGQVNKNLEAYKVRKKILKNNLQNLPNIKVIINEDKSEESCTYLHIQCLNQIKIKNIINKTKETKLKISQLSLVSSNCVWHWSSLLGKNSSYHKKLNPYLNSEINYDYSDKNYTISRDILERTIKIDIDISMSLDLIRLQAEKLRMIIDN
jgi:radical SAM protein with 4Fe4S-binding SPASM domain